MNTLCMFLSKMREKKQFPTWQENSKSAIFAIVAIASNGNATIFSSTFSLARRARKYFCKRIGVYFISCIFFVRVDVRECRHIQQCVVTVDNICCIFVLGKRKRTKRWAIPNFSVNLSLDRSSKNPNNTTKHNVHSQCQPIIILTNF